jgi:hypothetical protein
MSDKAVAQVRVLKAGPAGRPVAEVMVASSINPQQLATILHNVVSSQKVIGAAGLRPCACKSGLDINILDHFEEVIQIEA